MPSRTKLSLGAVLLLLATLAAAQRNLGELLDAGGKVLSAEEFRQELVQHVMVGPTASGGTLELMYVGNGTVQGAGIFPEAFRSIPNPNEGMVNGEWRIDDRGRICTSMMIGKTVLPFRCQFWFRYDKAYFLSDSDSDRSARVLRRTLKQ